MAQRIIDNSTGLVYEETPEQSISAFNAFVTQYGQAGVTLAQIKLAERTDLTTRQQQQMFATYQSPFVDKIDNHLNEIVTIFGGMISWHPPYMGKPGRDGVSEQMPGFYKLVLKTNILVDTKIKIGKTIIKRNLLIETSATKIVEYFLGVMESQVWYDLPDPIVCFFSGTQSSGYGVSTLTDDEMATLQAILDEADLEQ